MLWDADMARPIHLDKDSKVSSTSKVGMAIRHTTSC